MIYTIFIRLIPRQGHNSPIEYLAPKINFQTLVEHPHLLEIYHYILYHTFSKEDLWEWALALHGIPPGWLQVTCVGYCSIY